MGSMIYVPDKLAEPLKVIAKAQKKTLHEVFTKIAAPSIEEYLAQPTIKQFLETMKGEQSK